jgi:PKD repeat protein
MNPVALPASRPAGPVALVAVALLLFLVPTGDGAVPFHSRPLPAQGPGSNPVGRSNSGPSILPTAPFLHAGGWSNRTAFLVPSPPARWGAMMTYDALDGYLLLFGGMGTNHQALRDTWTYSNGAWHNITNTAGTAPSARSDGMMAYDAADGEVVLYGGIHLGTYQSDTWRFRANQWSVIPTNTSAGPLADGSMVFDAAQQLLVLFGGAPHPGTVVRNTTFTFSAGRWGNITASAGTAPPAMSRTSMTWDGHLNATVLFGGVGALPFYDQTWEFTLGHWIDLTNISDPTPPGRVSANLVYDAVDGYDVLYGGFQAGTSLNDTWAFRDGNWTMLPEATFPSARNAVAMAYASGPVASKSGIVLFGGRLFTTNNASAYSDTWTYKLPLQAVVTQTAPQVDVNRPVTIGITVAGGYGPYIVNWSNLPAGCDGPATTQSFVCVPQFVGTVDLRASVNDSVATEVNATSSSLTVEPFPTVTLSAVNSNGPAPLKVHFFENLTGGSSPFVYTWNFGDGTGTVQGNVNHTYSKQGEYTAALTVTDSDGAVAMSADLLINATATLSVVAAASIVYGWAPLVVSFSSQVTGGEAPYSYNWSLGVLGSHYSQSYASWNYTSPGTYEVMLNVTDALDKSNISILNVTVVAPLTAGFTASFPGGPVCNGNTVIAVLQLSALPRGGSAPYNESWSVNGSTLYGPTPSAAFPGGTSVPVNLTLTDARGNRTSFAHPVLIPTTACGSGGPSPGGVSPTGLELYTVGAIALLFVIAIEAGVLLRGRRGRST